MANWIGWNGGDCPVTDDTPVELRYRDENGQTFCFVPQALTWQHRPRKAGHDVVAYRVLAADEAAEIQREARAKNDRLNALRDRSLAERVA